MAIMSLKTHIIHWRKLEKTHREMFSRTNYMEEYSTKNHLALAKILQKIFWLQRKLIIFLNIRFLCHL